MTEVTDGAAELRIVEVPVQEREGKELPRATLTSSPGMRKIVVNVSQGQETPSVPVEKAKPVGMVTIRRAGQIVGPHVEYIKGVAQAARIVVREGLWEHRRGHKVDGGERRKAEVRAKRRAAERKAA